METNERVFCSQQLCCMLPPLAFKVMFYLIGWNKPEVKYYERQMCKFLHLRKDELQLAIQTLEDNNLIDVTLVEQTWMISINKETVKKYFNVKMDTVAEHSGIQLAKAITWNQVEESNSLSSISDEQLERMIQELQRRRDEKKKECKVVYSSGLSEEELLAQLPF